MSSSRPNILFFFTDQQRPDSIGCYGQELPTTPVLDGLAADGFRCARALTPNPVCGPARAALQTGRYPTATGNHVNNVALPEDATTVAKLLGGAGYATGYLGKWHLASNGRGTPDSYRTKPVPEARRGGYADYWLVADALEWTSHGYGGYLFAADGTPVVFDNSTYRVDFMTDHLLEAIDQLADDERPFYMMASYLEPHQQNDTDSYDPPKALRGKYDEATIPGDLAPMAGNWQRHYSNYLACVESLDGALGRVMAKLTERGIADNSLIVFATDHGCHFGTRNGEYKRSCHDASIHVPLILNGPGFRGGEVFDGLASLLDIPATMLKAAGIEIPADWHGRPLQEAGAEDWRQVHLSQISESQVGRCIRTDRWTYSVRLPGSPKKPEGGFYMNSERYVEDFLYDNEADPYQQRNLVCEPGYAGIRQELQGKLLAELAAVGEPPAQIEAPTNQPDDLHIRGAAQ
jgi:uncharacterized sulfatase